LIFFVFYRVVSNDQEELVLPTAHRESQDNLLGMPEFGWCIDNFMFIGPDAKLFLFSMAFNTLIQCSPQ